MQKKIHLSDNLFLEHIGVCMFTKYSNEKTEKPFLTETKQSLSVFVLIIIRLFVFIKKKIRAIRIHSH